MEYSKNKELTTEEIQKVSLEVLCDFHDFCVEHNLRYSLFGGTMLGAIRHKGFIPWDDDVDVIMPQPDYERFLKLWSDNDKNKLYAPELGNSYQLYARLTDLQKTQDFCSRPWHKGKSGVWIDIFPLAATPTSWDEYQMHIKNIESWRVLSYKMRNSLRRPWMYHDLKHIVGCIPLILMSMHIDKKNVLREAHKLIFDTYSWDESDFCGQVSFLACPLKQHHPKSWWSSYELCEFEGKQFYIASEYDEVLRNYYGDYMQLPPEDQRVPPHTSTQKFFWKQ